MERGHPHHRPLALIVALLLVGCGGGETEPLPEPDAPRDEPVEASPSPAEPRPAAARTTPAPGELPTIEALPDPAGVPDTPKGLENGAFAPELDLPDLMHGGRYALSAHVGPERTAPTRAVIVGFVASWCGPCRASLPTLKALREEHGEALEVVLLATDDDAAGRRKEVAHVKAAGLGASVLDPTEDVLRAYMGRRRNVPHFYIVNQAGEVLVQDRGFGDKVKGILPKQVRFALNNPQYVPRGRTPTRTATPAGR